MKYSLCTIQLFLLYALSQLSVITANLDYYSGPGIMDDQDVYRNDSGISDSTKKILMGVCITVLILFVIRIIYKCVHQSDEKAETQATNQQQEQNNSVVISITTQQTNANTHHNGNIVPVDQPPPPPYSADNIRPPNY